MLRQVQPVPTLDEILAAPERLVELPVGAAEQLFQRASLAQSLLLGRLLAGSHAQPAETATADRFMDIEEICRRMGVNRRWLHRHARELPFALKTGHSWKFSEMGFMRWSRQRQQGRS